MHVMHIIDSMHSGGAETSLLEVAPALARREIKTTIVTVLADDGGLEDRLDELGVECIRMNHLNPLCLAFELRKLIVDRRPDLLHTSLLFANLLGRIVGLTVRPPVVTTLANEDYGPEHRANARYGSWSVGAVHAADMITAPLTTRFHAISRDVAQVMSRRLRIPEDKIWVVYRGRDSVRLGEPAPERRLHVRAALSIDAKTPVVLSVARLDRQKGVDTTIDAFRHLVEHVPDAVLLIAGRRGNASALVEAKASGHPAIHLLGNRTDVPDLMCAADVLSFPSRWEGLGGTLIEAMALRLAIVASDIPALAETIGDVGWPLVPPDDGRVLANRLLSVLEGGRPEEAKKDAGQERFRQLFTVEAAANGMAIFYREVMRSSRAASSLRPRTTAKQTDDPVTRLSLDLSPSLC